VITNNLVERFQHKIDAFKKAQDMNPQADRTKASGFLLLVGSGPAIVDAGVDRDRAVEKAVAILNEQDTIVFLAKMVASVGDTVVTRDQLILTRKEE